MSKHTPGEWVIDWNVSRLDIFSADAKTLVASLRRSSLSSSIDEEAKANARLLAAAPDLLEALKALMARDLENRLNGFPEVAEARAAIAKATGEAK